MGHIATHAIVVANLITKGANHGMHLFMVQLRSLKDHKVLPGKITRKLLLEKPKLLSLWHSYILCFQKNVDGRENNYVLHY